MTPYEVKFKCFTPELAAALSGFANSPNGLLVKTINVEPAPAVEAVPDITTAAPIPIYTQPIIEAPTKSNRSAEEAAFKRRYGLDARRTPMPTPQPVVPLPVAPAPTSKGLQTVLDEKQVAVTMVLNVVKLLPSK